MDLPGPNLSVLGRCLGRLLPRRRVSESEVPHQRIHPSQPRSHQPEQSPYVLLALTHWFVFGVKRLIGQSIDPSCCSLANNTDMATDKVSQVSMSKPTRSWVSKIIFLVFLR